MSFAKLHEELKVYIEAYLNKIFEDSLAPAELLDAMEYSLFAGGKRLRPVMALYMARQLGVRDEVSLPLCASLEMIHTYSLIHDDLPAMDNDDLRRGKPTSHVKFGEDMAILAGDALLNFAFELMLKEYPKDNTVNYLKAVRYISECAGASGMIGGQVLDIKKSANDMADLKRMHGLKTGKMFSACIMSMVYLCDIPSDIEKKYMDFSEEFGLLFQITDDILDALGSTNNLGKTAGKDENSGKITYVTKYGIEGAEKMADEALYNCVKLLKETGKKHEYLSSLTEHIRRREK